jgi:hypothetical protein
MNADKRRWKFVFSALLAAAVVTSARSATAADAEFQLADEIERRFPATEEVASPQGIIDSAFPLTRDLPQRYPRPLILNFSFPSGEPGKGNLNDDSYHLAPDDRSYRGVTMLFKDERLLVAGQTFHR